MGKPSFLQRILIWIFKVINAIIPWHRLPSWIGTLNLLALRYELRAENLYDSYPTAAAQGVTGEPPMENCRYLKVRNSDGLFNSLEQPRMGCAGMRFGRNVSREHTKPPNHEELLTPNPRIISQELLQRDKFKPATIVNLLAAAWIQFQVHDWFNHTQSPTEKIDVPLPEGDKWTDGHMKVERTQRDEPLAPIDEEFPAYKNENTAWWDLSQVYGSTEARTKELRGSSPDGKLTVDVEKFATYLPRDDKGIPVTGFYSNWWLGLEMLHTLFVLEHNAICDELRKNYPDWTGDKIFDTARLVNSALSAKFHTVEWVSILTTIWKASTDHFPLDTCDPRSSNHRHFTPRQLVGDPRREAL